MAKKCLIIGYGRAGKRHAQYADKYGLGIYILDPYFKESDYHSWKDVPWFYFDYAILCTPPDQHVEQLKYLIDNGMRVMCEKPLCSIHQDEYLSFPVDDLQIQVAYNWYYNAQVNNIRGSSSDYRLFAEQSRILPEWGIENDHLPHDIFIIDYVSGGITDIDYCNLSKSERHQEICIEGKTRIGNFNITERVLLDPTERISKLNGIDLQPDPAMFDLLWQAFLARDYKPSLKDAVRTQNWLAKINNILEGNK